MHVDAADALLASLPFWFQATLLGVLGAIWGSFASSLCVRWPSGESVATGRSRCDKCGKTIASFDLIPLLSFAVLKGKCRSCQARISSDILAMEIAGVVLGILPLFFLPPSQALAAASFAWLLLPLIVLDIRHLWLPDRLTVLLALAGILAGPFLTPEISWIERVVGGVGGYAVFDIIRRVYRAVRHREGMGAGDPKLLGSIGIWLGWQALPIVILLASVVGLMWALSTKLLFRREVTAVAFGAMLSGSALLYVWSMASWMIH